MLPARRPIASTIVTIHSATLTDDSDRDGGVLSLTDVLLLLARERKIIRVVCCDDPWPVNVTRVPTLVPSTGSVNSDSVTTPTANVSFTVSVKWCDMAVFSVPSLVTVITANPMFAQGISIDPWKFSSTGDSGPGAAAGVESLTMSTE
jgi:hypothetical protein